MSVSVSISCNSKHLYVAAYVAVYGHSFHTENASLESLNRVDGVKPRCMFYTCMKFYTLYVENMNSIYIALKSEISLKRFVHKCSFCASSTN